MRVCRQEFRKVASKILSVRVGRTVDSDHTVAWNGVRRGLRHPNVCAGLRGARAEIEKRLDGIGQHLIGPLTRREANILVS